ncbi:pyridoxamine 5'-phosphate oxidase family protein [Streptomyces sp. NPDC059564]|uniref:pyridoxamine 5'-phosphate oxidase family protein n=1 Tax=Streptomyces sp. NPDC059564 TaxID=3346865 RepID=UPI0036883F96
MDGAVTASPTSWETVSVSMWSAVTGLVLSVRSRRCATAATGASSRVRLSPGSVQGPLAPSGQNGSPCRSAGPPTERGGLGDRTGHEAGRDGTAPLAPIMVPGGGLLATVSLGRIVFTEHALPAVRPVNHCVDGEDIVIRTHGGGTAAPRPAPAA